MPRDTTDDDARYLVEDETRYTDSRFGIPTGPRIEGQDPANPLDRIVILTRGTRAIERLEFEWRSRLNDGAQAGPVVRNAQ